MKKAFIILFILAFAGISQVQAQSFKVGVGGGLTLIQSPDFFDTYDMATGYHFGAKAKIGLPLLPIKITGQVYYNTFSGTIDEVEGFILPVSVDVSTDLLILGAGFEVSLIPGPIAPYLGADIFLSSIGKFEFEPSNVLLNGSEATSRMGLGFGAGLDFKLLPMFDIDLAAKYNLYNLVGKEDGEEDINAITITANFMFGF